jgi:hypothetical protein
LKVFSYNLAQAQASSSICKRVLYQTISSAHDVSPFVLQLDHWSHCARYTLPIGIQGAATRLDSYHHLEDVTNKHIKVIGPDHWHLRESLKPGECIRRTYSVSSFEQEAHIRCSVLYPQASQDNSPFGYGQNSICCKSYRMSAPGHFTECGTDEQNLDMVRPVSMLRFYKLKTPELKIKR